MNDIDRHTLVEGVFHDRDALTESVRGLLEKSVPADSIRVFVRDARGERSREVDVDDEAGTLRGALFGAAAGGGVALVLALAAAAGFLGPTRVEPLGLVGLSGAFAAALAGAAAGVPLGALLGMGRWRGASRIGAVEIRDTGAVVVVESSELAELAASVLRGTGAERVDVR